MIERGHGIGVLGPDFIANLQTLAHDGGRNRLEGLGGGAAHGVLGSWQGEGKRDGGGVREAQDRPRIF
jgi:hypothetical protein